MSYSFSARAATKEEAKTAVAAKFDEVVSTQPSHAKDRDAVVTGAAAFIDMLVEPASNQVVSVSVSGSLSWRAEGEYIAANVGISASLADAT